MTIGLLIIIALLFLHNAMMRDELTEIKDTIEKLTKFTEIK